MLEGDVSRGLQTVFCHPTLNSVRRVLHPALVYLHLVELDYAIQVLWACEGELCLVGQLEERAIVNVENESVCLYVIVKLNLPL